MTLSLHKLWGGSGYEYLTRQVARQDATHAGASSLASYYAERGESPGTWLGAGLAGVEGLTVGDPVSAEQMQALFGRGEHPLAAERTRAAAAAGLDTRSVLAAARLGASFPKRRDGSSALDREVDLRLASVAPATELSGRPALEARASMRSVVAAEWFRAKFQRAPTDAREMAGAVARWTRRPAQPVAGFDLTFSPVKSVSALWAVAPPSVAAQVERAHRAAVAEALEFLERDALYTREGAQGVRQVGVVGLVAAAFTHRDSRAGDPDLHTHVAVANKVQTRAGKWLAIDGRVLYAATVAASETYNTALERSLGERLGLRFTSVARSDGRRCVREVVGVDVRLIEVWSSRRAAIDERRRELSGDFHARHGRPPSRAEAHALAQQATLETRPAKHEPRTLAEQRSAWAEQAGAALGGTVQVQAMVAAALEPPRADAVQLDAAWIARAAAAVVATLETERSTWGRWHMRAEALRQVRATDEPLTTASATRVGAAAPGCHAPAGLPAGLAGQVADLVAAEAANRCVALHEPAVDPEGVVVPDRVRRPDGTSVYGLVDAQQWTSQRVLDAEDQLLAAAEQVDGRRLSGVLVEVAVAEAALNGLTLNPGQAALVRALAGSGRRLQLALAPAGTGKTTALRVLAQAWTASGGTVVGLAPSAAAAAVLADALDAPTDTLAKLVHSLTRPDASTPTWMTRLNPRTLVVVDEAGLADTLSLAAIVTPLLERGASVRLLGDDHQLGAIGAGGVLRDLDNQQPAVRLSEVVRFSDPAEAAASLALRDGRPEALGFYLDQHRVHVGDDTTASDQLFTAWTADQDAGRDSLMLAPTRVHTAHLNLRARTRRLEQRTATQAAGTTEVTLPDGNRASAGDTVVTRSNNRALRTRNNERSGQAGRTATSGWVRNGDRWTVQSVTPDGGLRVVSLRSGQLADLPAGYVSAWVELGYASTIHAAQGLTCDTVHGLVSGTETRRELYTLLTRGRQANHVYLSLEHVTPTHDLDRPAPDVATDATELLEQVLRRDGDAPSATSTEADLHDPSHRLLTEIARYLDSLHLAAEDTTHPDALRHLVQIAERRVPGLTDAPAWPTLQSQLLLIAATTASTTHTSDVTDVARPLLVALASGPLDGADDPAAVLHRRLTVSSTPTAGPLPWLPAIPRRLQAHPTWGPYLHARAALLHRLSEQVRHSLGAQPPEWAADLDRLPPGALEDVALWRAARQIQPNDPAVLGPPPSEAAAHAWHQHLQRNLVPAEPLPPAAARATAFAEHDPFRMRLAARLSRLAHDDSGVSATVSAGLDAAAAEGPLPDDHPSAALWWRLHRHLDPQILSAATQPHRSRSDTEPYAPRVLAPLTADQVIDTALLVAGLQRLTRSARRSQSTSADVAVGNGLDPIERQRLLHANELALDYFRHRYASSWAAEHLVERFGDSLDDDRFQPGYASGGWTDMVDHLRREQVTDDDIFEAGLAVRSRRGTLIDRFRNRLVLPIRDTNQDLVAFVGRRHPHLDNNGPTAGPKYLNTPDTPIYNKGRHLFGAHLLPPSPEGLAPSAFRTGKDNPGVAPVVVEGPLDAIAVTLASPEAQVGLATLGTSLTRDQAAILARYSAAPTLAFDADPAGVLAAERAFWTLTFADTDPQIAHLPEGTDPTDLYQRQGPDQLRAVLRAAEPLARHLARAAGRHGGQGVDQLLRIVAARPPHTWAPSLDVMARQGQGEPSQLRTRLLRHLRSSDDRPTSKRSPRPSTPSDLPRTPVRAREATRSAADRVQAAPATVSRAPSESQFCR